MLHKKIYKYIEQNSKKKVNSVYNLHLVSKALTHKKKTWLKIKINDICQPTRCDALMKFSSHKSCNGVLSIFTYPSLQSII